MSGDRRHEKRAGGRQLDWLGDTCSASSIAFWSASTSASYLFDFDGHASAKLMKQRGSLQLKVEP